MFFQVKNILKNNYYYTYKNHKTIVKISTKKQHRFSTLYGSY